MKLIMTGIPDRKGKDFWVEVVLENKDLAEITNYLQSITDKPVIITDHYGKIYSHSSEVKIVSPDDLFTDIPYITIASCKQNYFYYNQNLQKLYYYTGFTEKDACIIVMNIENPVCAEKWEEYFDDVSVAIKVYIYLTKEKEKTRNHLTHQLIEDILIRNACNIKDIAKQYNWMIDLNKLYYVAVLEPEPIAETKLYILHEHAKEWLKHSNLDIICSIWNNRYIVFLCPTHFDAQTLEADQGWDRHLNNIRRHQRDIANRFNISASFGIGRKYPLSEVHKSYQEALIALNISKLTGKRHFVKHFLDLGLFTILNYEDSELAKQFCRSVLGKLLDYDSTSKGELLLTLKNLFDTNFDSNETAKKMYIHSNTLRYRMKKIEELTNMKLEKIEDRLNLFVAVKLYDLLINSGLFK